MSPSSLASGPAALAGSASSAVVLAYDRRVVRSRTGAAAEFLAWADSHQRQRRLHGAEMAQITRHPELAPERDAIGQQRVWALRHGRERRLAESSMAQLRHR
jgi:hypothetical protein